MTPIRIAIFNIQKELRINGDTEKLLHILDLLVEVEKGDMVLRGLME